MGKRFIIHLGIQAKSNLSLRNGAGGYQTSGTTSTRGGVRPEYSQSTISPTNYATATHSGYTQVPHGGERIPTKSVAAEPHLVSEPLYGRPYIAGVEEFIEPGPIIEPAHAVTKLTGERLSPISARPGPDAHLPEVNTHQDREVPILEELL